MNDVRLVCEEFGFSALLTQVSDFVSARSVAEDEARKSVSDSIEENLQIKGALFPLREVLSGLRRANLHMEKKARQVRKSNRKRRTTIAAVQDASSHHSEENQTLRKELGVALDGRTKMEKAHGQEIAILGNARDDLRAEMGEETTKESTLAAEKETLAQVNEAQKKEIAALRKQQERLRRKRRRWAKSERKKLGRCKRNL
jgi:hypothetical protein